MARESAKQIGQTRTGDLRREIDRAQGAWKTALRSRPFGLAAVVWVCFTVVVGSLVAWTREQPNVAVGRVMSETRTVRTSFDIVDEAATEQLRNLARVRTPRVYVQNQGVIEEIEASLAELPRAFKDTPTLADVDPGLRQLYGLTEDSLAAIRREIVDGAVSDRWASHVRRLVSELSGTPILEPQTYQIEVTSPNDSMELRRGAATIRTVSSGVALNAEDPRLGEELARMAVNAQFDGPLIEVVATRLRAQLRPTYTFDAAATAAAQEAAARRVQPQKVTYPDREVIYRRGDVLTPTQKAVTQEAIKAESRALKREARGEDPRDGAPGAGVVGPQREPVSAWAGWRRWADVQWRVWTPRLAAIGLVGAVALAIAGYTALFCPRIRRNPVRIAAVAALMAGAALVACWATVAQPGLIALTGVAPTVFVAVILAVAYDQRMALAYGALHGIIVAAALDQPIGLFAVMVAGIGVAVWLLKEVRDRDALIRMGMFEGVALALGTFVVNMLELPASRAALEQASWDAGLAGFAGLLVAGVTLFILPSMERAFDITTGMTLVELRDPKNPLLRQLQQRAPGTYNHSLNLGSLAEAAAEAIGANGLLAYVGALYHDIGKMNKPDYFVENQVPGFNKHDKLSPAMSLLIIVGHVKDGMELAREFGLPRPLHHFIESHHGTTLVEYFYHRARRQAAEAAATETAGGEAAPSAAAQAPTEMEYRYPGPKPRTKEAAIVMLCDAVESAARAMADPTPSRIDATVRAIATKRLMDGQFDECDITLRDLNVIVETVSKTLASIYHGRIAYPTSATSAPDTQASLPSGTWGAGSGARPAPREDRPTSGGALSGMPPVLRTGNGSRDSGVSVRRKV